MHLSLMVIFFLLFGCKSAHQKRDSHNLMSDRAESVWTPDISRVEFALKRIRSLNQLPNFSTAFGSQDPVQTDLPEPYKEVFQLTSNYLFGDRRPVQAVLCDGADLQDCDEFGGAKFEKSRMAVLVSSSSGKNSIFQRRNSAAFIMVHEISHYLAEVIVTLDGNSPNGFPSILEGGDSLGSTLRDQMQVGGMAHAEIDAFALVIMRKLGLSTSEILSTLRVGERSMADQIKKIGENDSTLVNLPNPETIRVRSMKTLLRRYF